METFYKNELNTRDKTIDQLETRIGNLERRSGLTDIFFDKQKLAIDDNKQYSRRHSLRLYGMEKKNPKESADQC